LRHQHCIIDQEIDMTFAGTLLSIAALTTTTLATTGCAAPVDQHGGRHPVQTDAVLIAQAASGGPGRGMGMHAGTPAPAYAEQMKAMQEMHEKMLSAKTPEERNALMTSQMTLMHNGMSMMGEMGGMNHMGAGSMMGKPAEMPARQGMMEQRMDMMQSMMQMMMDRMQVVPVTK
jgi:hypothetical protein